MASSFADALDLGAPPRPPRPRPRPARVGPPAGPGLRVGADRSGPGRRRPGRNRPGRGRQRARHRPRRPQCRRGRTHQHPRRRGHGLATELRGSNTYVDLEGYSVGGGAGRRARGAGRGVAGRFMAVLSCLDHLNAVGPPGRLFRGRLSHRGVVGAGAGPTGPAGPAGPAGAPPLRAIMPIPIPGPPPPGEKDPMTTGVGP